MRLTRKDFEEIVVSALKTIPKGFKKRMENVEVVIEPEASRELLEELGPQSPFDLFGLYQGIPLDQRGFYYGNVLPDKITLFQAPIESVCQSMREAEERVKEVLLHEIGHYFGLDEAKLRELADDEGGE